ncbi:hypothetical protein NDU88_004122 [Pleurodeles waltl]|uniref:Uncharacterized protein n=1 Tax=Pleurodeles waltl TaxID=8319 RepID=A0AAV7RJE6_PLEWA|nr:hypothetical protein NDU88_004122 [Pleurodeles waltl]
MTEEDCADLLRDSPLQGLSKEERDELDAELSEEEVTVALQGLQSGKAVGPNGPPMELFKCLGSKLAKHMLAMFLEARKMGALRWISGLRLLYRCRRRKNRLRNAPISLFNTEVKVLAFVLATRLCAIITELIHPDQSDFMPSRPTRLNLRRLYRVLQMTDHQTGEQAALLSLYASVA